MAKPVPRGHRHVLDIHDAGIAMAESVKATSFNPQHRKQRIEFALPYHVSIPGCSILGCE
jgi:hypothetical protein